MYRNNLIIHPTLYLFKLIYIQYLQHYFFKIMIGLTHNRTEHMNDTIGFIQDKIGYMIFRK